MSARTLPTIAVALLVISAVTLTGCSATQDQSAPDVDDSAESSSTSPAGERAGDDNAGGSGDESARVVGAPASSRPLFDDACAGRLSVRPAGATPTDLTSISGLAAGRRTTEVVWSIEDSFEPAELVAMSFDGVERARIGVRGGLFANVDWEDLALEVGDDDISRIYIADIGDNLGIRSSLKVLVVDEPALDATDATARTITMRYRPADGVTPRPNAEAMVVQRGAIWVIDKFPDGPATLYRLEPDATDPDRGDLVAVSTVDLPGEQVTAADLSPDGSVLALRTDAALRLYPVDDGEDIAEALSATPCVAPSIPERQGESVAILAGVTGLLTVSENESGGQVQLHLTAPG